MTMGMHIVKPEESWDLWWCTTPMDFKKAKTLKKYQVSYSKYQLVFDIILS